MSTYFLKSTLARAPSHTTLYDERLQNVDVSSTTPPPLPPKARQNPPSRLPGPVAETDRWNQPSWRVASARRVGTCSAPCNLDILRPVALPFLPPSCQWKIRNGSGPRDSPRSCQATRVQSAGTLYPGVVDREILTRGPGGLFLACRSRLWVMAEWPGEGECDTD